MSGEQVQQWARQSGMSAALSLIDIGYLEAFAKLVRGAALDEAIDACKEYASLPKVDSGVPLAIANRIGLLK